MTRAAPISPATWTALAAGIFYCSWPLGPVLNPAGAARGLASELGHADQPFNWVFNGADIVCGILMLVAMSMMVRAAPNGRRLPRAVLANLAVFAVGTIAAAARPGGPMHLVASVISSLCLVLSLLLVWWVLRRDRWLTILVVLTLAFGAVTLYELPGHDRGNWGQHYLILLNGVWLAAVPGCWQRLADAAGVRRAGQPRRYPTRRSR